MGRSVKKKVTKETKYVTREDWKKYLILQTDFVEAVDKSLGRIEDTLALDKKHPTIIEDLCAETVDLRTRIANVEAKTSIPPIFYVPKSTKLTEEILASLKQPNPVTFSTPRPPHYDGTRCVCTYGCQLQTAPPPPKQTTFFCKTHNIHDHHINGVLCDSIAHNPRQAGKSTDFGCPEPAFIPKVSKWRNSEERCEHLYKAVKKSLICFDNIEYAIGTTAFSILIRLYGHTKVMAVNITTNSIELSFNDKNGTPRVRAYPNTTEAAADIVGLAVFYSLKR